ncbi:MAG: phytoene/squalene synthase family protein [Rhizobiales bacterium]|nr:phytoene/squalene synthase family protein [Hyphomicrobiales bacterium]
MLRLDFATPADLAHCRQMIRQGSRSFHLASLLLPTQARGHARALYGFCRMADDLVDQSEDATEAVAMLARRLDLIYAGEPAPSPTDRAFADVVHRFAIPRSIPEALIEGFAWDSIGRSYDSYSEVVSYGVRVAGTVGVMMSLIMGQRNPQALARAIDLGVAMQLSNIARDIEDDARLGRVYVPGAWLRESGCTPGDVLAHAACAAEAASRLVAEADLLYARARVGIAMLPRSCRASINAARLLYREIGCLAARQRHRGRAVVGGRRKAALVLRAIAEVPMLPGASTAPCLPEGQFLVDDVVKTPAPASPYQGFSGQMGWVIDMLMSVEGRKQ